VLGHRPDDLVVVPAGSNEPVDPPAVWFRTSSQGGMAIDRVYLDSTMGGMHPDYVLYHLHATPGYVPPTNAEIIARPDVLAAYLDWWRRYEAGEFVIKDGWREEVVR
jgi:hypothetical protein